MWIFKRKKKIQRSTKSGIACTFCQSMNTIIITHHGSDQANYIRTWRGQRYFTSRCLECGKDFYAEVPDSQIEDQIEEDDRLVDDEEALREAENELKRKADNDNDHRF